LNRAGRSELGLRVASAVVLLAISLTLTWAGGTGFALMCAAGCLIVLIEFRRLVVTAPAGTRTAAVALAALAFLAWFLAGPVVGIACLAAGFAALLAWEWLATRSVWSAAGLAYGGLPFFALTALRGESRDGLLAVLLVFSVAWGSDILAYFAGRAIGGPKLAPRISPNKTWAGFFGGLAGALLLATAVAIGAGRDITLGAAAFFLALSLLSQWGDLFESWLKRRFAAKDSGALIPGHGGAMDRVDGLVFASVATWLFGLWRSGLPIGEGEAQALLSALFAP
jgi:phosphatidate cytidylyltransferase